MILPVASGGPGPPEILETDPATLGPTIEPVSSATTGSSSDLVPIVLAVALGLSLIIVAIALTPPWVLPRPVGAVVYERRDALVYVGIGTALSIGTGLLIALGAS